MDNEPAPPSPPVWILYRSDKYDGYVVAVHGSRESAEQGLAAYVRGNWDDLGGNGLPDHPP